MRRLLLYDFNIPGGYQYKQPETGMKFDGNTPWKAQIRTILRHRKSNGLNRVTLEEVWDDLEAYTCDRVPGLCTEFNAKSVTRLNAARQVKKCGGCGGRRK